MSRFLTHRAWKQNEMVTSCLCVLGWLVGTPQKDELGLHSWTGMGRLSVPAARHIGAGAGRDKNHLARDTVAPV